MTTALTDCSPTGFRRSPWGARLLNVRELPILLALVVVVLLTWIQQPRFLAADNVRGILLAVSLVTVIAMGETVVILTRGVDVSIGSTMAVAGMSVAIMYQRGWIGGVASGLAVAIAIGAMAGVVNGALVALARVPPIIATLGTFGVYRALAFAVSGGRTVSEHQLPAGLTAWSLRGPAGTSALPWSVVIALGAAVATFALLRWTRFGRNLYAVGGNAEAARMRGVPVRPVVLGAYVFSGVAAGVAAMMSAARYGSINPEQIGAGRELAAIAAAAVGGVSIFGGSGGVPGVVLACLLLGTIETALTALGIDPGWQLTAYGAAILLAMAFDVWVGRLRRE